ncbi:MAG: hypothetical protein K2X24_07010, partial [Methylobacterium sp.]|nr:hypothetical protein [Methylobacterium sp.]
MTIRIFARPFAAVALGLAALVPAAAADLTKEKAPIVPAEVPSGFFLFSDTQVSYRYQFPAANPGSQVQR